MDLFNKVHIFKAIKSLIDEPNTNLISLIGLMFNYAKPRSSSLFEHEEIIPLWIFPVFLKPKSYLVLVTMYAHAPFIKERYLTHQLVMT